MIEGILAGLLADGSLYGLEAIKSRQQSSFSQVVATTTNYKHLYFGLEAGLVGSAATGFIYFGAYESILRLCNSNEHFQTLANASSFWPFGNARHFIAGGLADLACSVVSVPVDTVKSRLQVHGPSKYRGALHLLGQMLKHEGPSSLYRSFGWTIARDVPYSAIQFGIWAYLGERGEDASNANWWLLSPFACGMIAGAVAGAITNPMDVLKTRRQLLISTGTTMTRTPRGSPIWLLGIWPRTVACALYSGLLLGVYSLARDSFG